MLKTARNEGIEGQMFIFREDIVRSKYGGTAHFRGENSSHEGEERRSSLSEAGEQKKRARVIFSQSRVEEELGHTMRSSQSHLLVGFEGGSCSQPT